MRLRLRDVSRLGSVVFLWVFLTWNHTHAALKSTKVPRYDAAVGKAVSFLQRMDSIEPDHKTLVAYALLKAGVAAEDQLIEEGIALARQRCMDCKYDLYHGLYLAALDAMLLADSGNSKFSEPLQKVANFIESAQREDGAWFDIGLGRTGPGDVSLTQYSVLGLWAAQRSGCQVSPSAFDRATVYLNDNSNLDGGWAYHPGQTPGNETGKSSHNMTLAAIGTIGVSRILFFPGYNKDKPVVKFGTLQQVQDDVRETAFSQYNSTIKSRAMTADIRRGLTWNKTRFAEIPPTRHKLYFYYTLERVAALVAEDDGLQQDWYTTYGDALLTLQLPDGHFSGHHPRHGDAVGTSFAILYYVRSTQQILKYGRGLTTGGRDLASLLNPQPPKRKEIGALDDLLTAMEGKDFADLDANPEDVVETIQFSSRDELVGKADQLKILLKSPDADNRQIAYWALSRTGDFNLVPLMLDGLDDPDLSVSVEALTGLRYIARMPKGFNLTLDPLGRLPDDSDEATKLNEARVWKDKASSLWRKWYSGVRPYEERDGLDELALPTGAPN